MWLPLMRYRDLEKSRTRMSRRIHPSLIFPLVQIGESHSPMLDRSRQCLGSRWHASGRHILHGTPAEEAVRRGAAGFRCETNSPTKFSHPPSRGAQWSEGNLPITRRKGRGNGKPSTFLSPPLLKHTASIRRCEVLGSRRPIIRNPPVGRPGEPLRRYATDAVRRTQSSQCVLELEAPPARSQAQNRCRAWAL